MRLTDGGLETSLIFDRGLDLPHFAAFPLVEGAEGKAALESYWMPFLEIAHARGAPFVVDTATWRANADWGDRLGYDARELRRANEVAASFARHVAGHANEGSVNGVVGPRGDGYLVGDEMSAEDAEAYHRPQVEALAGGGVDSLAAVTFTYPAEAIGFVRATADLGVPTLVSFTVETDGRLPNGSALPEALEEVDRETDGAAGGFMVNCAHPSHFEAVLTTDGPWLSRIHGIRANASTMSHAELDAAEALDDGDPDDLARRYRSLLDRLPALDLLGGCCGTDHRHIGAIARACLPAPPGPV